MNIANHHSWFWTYIYPASAVFVATQGAINTIHMVSFPTQKWCKWNWCMPQTIEVYRFYLLQDGVMMYGLHPYISIYTLSYDSNHDPPSLSALSSQPIQLQVHFLWSKRFSVDFDRFCWFREWQPLRKSHFLCKTFNFLGIYLSTTHRLMTHTHGWLVFSWTLDHWRKSAMV